METLMIGLGIVIAAASAGFYLLIGGWGIKTALDEGTNISDIIWYVLCAIFLIVVIGAIANGASA